jgi:hypothetical protein
MNENR